MNITIEDIYDFFKWKDSQKSELRGEKIMYDINGEYKWLDEIELFDYYLAKNKKNHGLEINY